MANRIVHGERGTPIDHQKGQEFLGFARIKLEGMMIDEKGERTETVKEHIRFRGLRIKNLNVAVEDVAVKRLIGKAQQIRPQPFSDEILIHRITCDENDANRRQDFDEFFREINPVYEGHENI